MVDARKRKTRGENILSANMSGHAIDNTTADWCRNLPDSAHDKLVKEGLNPPRTEDQANPAVHWGNFLDDYIARGLISCDTSIISMVIDIVSSYFSQNDNDRTRGLQLSSM